jgi:GTP cyclohydrolase I
VPFKPALVSSARDLTAELASDLVDTKAVMQAVRLILEGIGEDPARPGLVDTPKRVAESYRELFGGYAADPAAILDPLPNETGEGLIMVRDIEITSMCEHHLLPFTGRAAVAYLPGEDGRITGLSKLARVVEVLSRRLQVQERLVREVADAMEAALAPRGVYVLVEAEHLCMAVRGAQKPGSVTVTTEVRGVFAGDAAARTELLALARVR